MLQRHFEKNRSYKTTASVLMPVQAQTVPMDMVTMPLMHCFDHSLVPSSFQGGIAPNSRDLTTYHNLSIAITKWYRVRAILRNRSTI